jgi:hypothetical protein
MTESKIINNMISLCINDIPMWLRDSELYNNLIDNDVDDEFEIDSFYVRENSIVSNFEEFEDVCKITSYWMMNMPPSGLLDFLEIFIGENYEEFKLKCKDDNIILSDWWDIFDIVYYYSEDKNELLSKFILMDNVKMVEYYRCVDNPITFHNCIESAGISKQILVYCLITVKGIWIYEEDEECFYADCLLNAVFKNKLECVEYILSSRPSLKDNDESIYCSKAAEGGSLECLTFLHENGFSWDCITTLNSAWKGHLNCLKYAVTNGCPYQVELLYASTPECSAYMWQIINMDNEDIDISDSDDENYRPYDARPY